MAKKSKTPTPPPADSSGSRSDFNSITQTAITSGNEYRELLKSSYPKIWKSATKAVTAILLIGWVVLYIPDYVNLIRGWRIVELTPNQPAEIVVPQGFVLDWEVQQTWFDWGDDEVSVTTTERDGGKIAAFSSDEKARIRYRRYEP